MSTEKMYLIVLHNRCIFKEVKKIGTNLNKFEVVFPQNIRLMTKRTLHQHSNILIHLFITGYYLKILKWLYKKAIVFILCLRRGVNIM